MAGSTRTRKGARGLTAAQRLFAHLVSAPGVSQAAAYLEAFPGVTQRTAEVEGSKLLKKPEVAELVERLREKRLAKVDSRSEQVLEELHHLGLARLSRVTNDDGSMKPLSEWPEREKAALSKLEVKEYFGKPVTADDGAVVTPLLGRSVKARMDAKLGALNTLAEHHGLVKPKDGGNVQMRLEELILLARKSLELEQAGKAGGEPR
jgi:phage terminase small subunit